MKVKELIAILEKQDEELEIYYSALFGEEAIHEVRLEVGNSDGDKALVIHINRG